MAYPWSAHDILTAADLNAAILYYAPRVVLKTVDESVTSSITPQSDNELLIAFGAPDVGRLFAIDCMICVTGAAAGDIRTLWLRTGTLTIAGNRSVLGPASGSTDATNTSVRDTSGHAGTTNVTLGTDGTNVSLVRETMILRVDVAGTLTLQWAQGTSSGTATTVKVGSYLMATPLSP